MFELCLLSRPVFIAGSKAACHLGYYSLWGYLFYCVVAHIGDPAVAFLIDSDANGILEQRVAAFGWYHVRACESAHFLERGDISDSDIVGIDCEDVSMLIGGNGAQGAEACLG